VNIDANDFLMGGGVKSASFPTVGTTVTGPIVRKPEVRQQTDLTTGEPKTFSNGDPMLQLVVQIGTDQRDPADPADDGVRGLYIKGAMLAAVRAAVRAAGAKGLEVGGILTVTYTSDGTVAKRGFNPPKLYSATYQPPTSSAAADAFLGAAAPTTPAPVSPAPTIPQQPAPAAPQPVTVNGAQVDLSTLDPATRALIEQQVARAGSGTAPF
jgi:hypothetical protein